MYTIKEIEPKHQLLKKYITSYNIVDFGQNLNVEYFMFPQKGISIYLFKNTDIAIDSLKITISEVKKENSAIIILGKYLLPINVKYNNSIDEVSINFTSTGVNHFFPDSYRTIAPNEIQLLQNEKWQRFTSALFAIEGCNDRINFIENFLIQQLQEKKLPQLEKAIYMIENHTAIKISELAKQCGLTERTLNRKFNEYVGCSPSVLKKIHRFRNTIESKFWNTEKLSLTEICLVNNYSDSSHFTKEFKHLTNQSPKTFFANISKVGKSKYPYMFI